MAVPFSGDLINVTASEKPLIKKSLKWGMIKEDLSIVDKFQLIKSLGFDGVELDIPCGSWQHRMSSTKQ